MSDVDWGLHARLKEQGRLNILFQLSEPCASRLSNVPVAPQDRSNIVPFVSRAEHLAWRKVWTQGRFVRLSWPAEERDAILRQDELFRTADAAWAERHGPIPGGATMIQYPGPERSMPAAGEQHGR